MFQVFQKALKHLIVAAAEVMNACFNVSAVSGVSKCFSVSGCFIRELISPGDGSKLWNGKAAKALFLRKNNLLRLLTIQDRLFVSLFIVVVTLPG